MHYKLFLYTFFLSSLFTKLVGADAHLGSHIGQMYLGTEKADSKILYKTGQFAAKTVSQVTQNGLVGTVEALRLGLAAGGAAIELVKEENETQKIGKATEAATFSEAIDQGAAKFQAHMGVENPANVKLYQGDAEPLKETAFANQNASFDKKINTINYNTSREGFNKIGTVADDLAHEGAHKAMSENTFTKGHINANQEERIAQLIGGNARNMAESLKDKSKPQPVLNSRAWNARNSGELKNHNIRLAKTDGSKVKASPGLLADRVPIYSTKKFPLTEQQLFSQSQEALTKKGKKVTQEVLSEGAKAVDEGVESIVDFSTGAINAWMTNQIGGLGRVENGSTVFKQGQKVGDYASLATGTAEIKGGPVVGGRIGTVVGTTVATGTSFGTAGLGTSVAIPTGIGIGTTIGTGIGVGIRAHGSLVTLTALKNLAKSHTLNSTQTPGDPKTQGVDDKAIKNNNGEPVKQTPKVEPKKNGGKQPKGELVINSNGEAVKQNISTDNISFGKNFDKKVRKHIDQVRKRNDKQIDKIPSPNKGGAEKVKEIIQKRVSEGGERRSTFAGEPAIFYEDGDVSYVFRENGEFWTILKNSK